MTREELLKHWDIIKSYKCGKELDMFDTYKGTWVPITGPTFNLDSEYRIREEPKYIPFDYGDIEKLIGRSVKCLSEPHVGVIVYVNRFGVAIGQSFSKFEDLLNDFKFLDGSKCGKLC
jgi:hypothetical protein